MHHCRSVFHSVKSPLDSDWQPGDNDSALDKELSTDAEQRAREARSFTKTIKSQTTDSETAPMKMLKRASLPSTTKWNGTAGTLEDFISMVEGHIDQQPHLNCIVNRKFMTLWLQHGQPGVILFEARAHNVHFSVDYINSQQLHCNISWLCGALKGALHK